MGLVRSKNRVRVGEWNRLIIRRLDFKGFVQLNNGPETGTLSKVSVLADGFRIYYAALLLGGGRILRRTLSVCPSVRLSVHLSVCPSVPCADVLCLQLHGLTSEHTK